MCWEPGRDVNAMRRSSRRLSRPRSDLTSTAATVVGPENGWPSSSANLAVSPSGAELSRGALVQTAVFARVLGLRLLTLEGTIVLVPTTIGAPDARRPL